MELNPNHKCPECGEKWEPEECDFCGRKFCSGCETDKVSLYGQYEHICNVCRKET